MIIDILIAFLVAAGVALLAMGLFHLKFRDSLFSKIRFTVGLCFFLLTFALYVFALVGVSIWSVSIIPFVCLVALFFLTRNAIGKLLKTDHKKSPQD